jgi:ERCC4-type nuclease
MASTASAFCGLRRAVTGERSNRGPAVSSAVPTHLGADLVEGIEKYLASGMIRGIGPVYAKKLIRAFGEKVFDVIEAAPRRLREVDGVGPVRAARITAAWAEQKRSCGRSWYSCTATASARHERYASTRPTAPTPSKS